MEVNPHKHTWMKLIKGQAVKPNMSEFTHIFQVLWCSGCGSAAVSESDDETYSTVKQYTVGSREPFYVRGIDPKDFKKY